MAPTIADFSAADLRAGANLLRTTALWFEADPDNRWIQREIAVAVNVETPGELCGADYIGRPDNVVCGCAIGGLRANYQGLVAAGHEVCSDGLEPHYNAAIVGLSTALWPGGITRRGINPHIFSWNDADGQTAANVIFQMRNAANLLEDEANRRDAQAAA